LTKAGKGEGNSAFSSLVKEECHSDGEVVVLSFPDFDSIISYLKTSLGPNDVLITMGAGEQYKIGDNLLA
jgi:UDP-N-acetylmuramate-alanine ligase